MTRKETLLRKKYELQNTLRALRGEEPLDLESLTSGWQFRKAIEDTREYCLKYAIENLEKAIDEQKLKNEIKASADAFYMTAEGEELKAALEAEQAELSNAFYSHENKCREELKKFIKDLLGDHWTVKFLSDTALDFSVWDAEKTDFVFGQSIEVRVERNSFLSKGSERFEANVGTTGSFKLNGQNPGDRARFYIDFGKFLSCDLDWLKNFMFDLYDHREKLRERIREVNSRYENPLGLQGNTDE